jgi:hypothetical protein
MFGGGMRGGGGNLRVIRLGALAAILLLGATLHYRGTAYITIRIIYIVLVVGVILFAVVRRRGGPGGGLPGRYGARRRTFGRPPDLPPDSPDPDAGTP